MKLSFLFIVSILIAGCDNNPSGTYTKDDKIQRVAAIDGEALLKANCNNCHNCFDAMTAPPLNGSMKRWNSKENLIAFVQNSEPVLRNDKYAAELKKKYGGNYIHRFIKLDSNQIKAMIYYCDFYQR